MASRPYYDSAVHKIPALEEIREISRYKYLLLQLTRRDILARYKRSILGVAWTMLNPLGMMIILSLVFSQLFVGVKSYPAYVLSGLVAWNFFAQSTNAAMSGLVWGGSLIQRIYIPRTAFGISAIGTALVNILLSLVPLALVMLVTHIAFHVTIIFIPISIILLSCFSLGVGLILSTMAVYFPDVAEMYQIILLAWFYLTPIIYPEQILPANLHGIFVFNPMYYLVRLFRLPLLDGHLPSLGEFLPAAVFGIGILIIGWIFFTSKSDEFAYRI
ncbi:MAG TPA: ABC transporter permease [Anaerolineales bacterium]|nr:ABC transporter permease [Anaerolineales bacterium]